MSDARRFNGRKCSVDIYSRAFRNVFHKYLRRTRLGKSVKGVYKRLGCKRSTFLSIIERQPKLYQIAQHARMERSSIRLHRLLKGIHLYANRTELHLSPKEIVKESHINYQVLCTKCHEYQRSHGNIMSIMPNNKVYIKAYVMQLKKKISKQNQEISKLKQKLNSRRSNIYVQKD